MQRNTSMLKMVLKNTFMLKAYFFKTLWNGLLVYEYWERVLSYGKKEEEKIT